MRACILLAVCLACGGRIKGSSDAGTIASPDAGLPNGWTTCTSPNGAIVCGGPGNQCDQACPHDGCENVTVAGQQPALRACDDPATAAASLGVDPSADCHECQDGDLCIDPAPLLPLNPTQEPINENLCVISDYGALYSANGYGAFVAYADHSTYTGDPLPVEATCPQIPGVPLCGGPCGSCPTGFSCTGRSPLHPYSLCLEDSVPDPAGVTAYCCRGVNHCNAGRECFTFKVDDAGQQGADDKGLCINQATCEAAAAAYPGGAYCTP